ncbi:hypothetical protein DSM3645_04095 [Blastopirellula marina DSM 3645]|uniref:Uncharacterized protein n=1 Tax=Blastopirellula marina DSM 3645 TaxID=314230 RepID=A4A1X8_9BACT|nr:hypothetical protein DSM3645_04095 [Blastopirellula marina DSM 3645]
MHFWRQVAKSDVYREQVDRGLYDFRTPWQAANRPG